MRTLLHAYFIRAVVDLHVPKIELHTKHLLVSKDYLPLARMIICNCPSPTTGREAYLRSRVGLILECEMDMPTIETIHEDVFSTGSFICKEVYQFLESVEDDARNSQTSSTDGDLTSFDHAQNNSRHS